MSIKCKMVPGYCRTKDFKSPHGIALTAISTPAGESIELEYDGIALQVSYNDIEYLMQKARKQ